MLVRYVQFVDTHPGAALVRLGFSPFHANREGRRLYDEHRDDVLRLLADAESTRSLIARDVGGVRLHGIPLFGEDERIDGVLAACIELADLPRILHDVHAPLRHFAQIVHVLPQIVMTARPNGQIDFVSRRWNDVFAMPLPTLQPHAYVFAAVAAPDRVTAGARYAEGIRFGAPFEFELRMSGRAGERWYSLQATPWRTAGSVRKWSIVLVDVDATRRWSTALERSQRRLRLSAEVGEALTTPAGPAEMVAAIAEHLSTWSGADALVEVREHGERIASVAAPRAAYPALRRLASRARENVGEAAGPIAVFPIASQGDAVTGFIAFGSAGPWNDEDDVRLVNDVARRVAAGVANTLRQRREGRISNALQRAMLPVALPSVTGIEFDVAYAPATSDFLVGGDWYDAFVLRDGRIVVAIGDVAGHGLEAAIVMNDIRRTIRSTALDTCDPAAVLAQANAFARLERHPMTTAFLGILDPLTLEIEYASAGHPMPLLADHEGALVHLLADGPPLGVVDSLTLSTRTFAAGDDCAIVLFTDGVLESNRDFERSEQRLLETLQTWATSGFLATAEQLQREIVGDAPRGDDAATFVVRIAPAREFSIAFPATPIDSRRARIALQRWLRRRPISAEAAADFTLATAEAMNNAAEHAYAGKPGTVWVRAHFDRAGASAEIEDRGRWRDGSSPERGRGLFMMQALTDRCVVDSSAEGTVVRLSMTLEDDPVFTHAADTAALQRAPMRNA